ncbi:DUF4238 domain-containing protein [Sphingomonas sp. CFBP 13603]|uniref:DUF4238 domain-containing protein n=1 Tax=Sphingomonas sp. CFBP 13603 TaxID=2774040 RepID=UPI001866B1BD|nr:DUF4238 domain-containing protein [Sphingomonas sp. CFBP 13603]MBE2993058.1 DUF4238 domain-containing protein [Sphingomonas sp. CFBP 13603]
MKSDNPPLDHHYIPQFLLHEWTVDGKLHRFQKPTPGKIVEHRKPTRAVGFRERLYEIPEYPPETAQSIEQGFMKTLDDTAAIAHKLLLAKNFADLDQTHRSAWTRFLLSLMLRTPDNLAAYKAGFAAVYDTPTSDIQAKYEAQKGPHDPPMAEEFLKLHQPMAPLTAALIQLPHVMQNKGLGQHIIKMGWSVAEVTRGAFLISDEVLITSNGLGKDDGHIVMPISPTKVFIATNNKKTLDTIIGMGEPDLVKTANAQIVGRAKYFVGAHNMSQKRFIENRFGLAPRTSIAKLFAEKYAATPNAP